jgi:hypothetical protein
MRAMDSDNSKDLRRQKLADKTYKKPIVSEEQRFVSKSKKQHKRKIQDMKAEELWEDWENEIS